MSESLGERLPLGERLALVASKYSKNVVKKRNTNTLRAMLASLPKTAQPLYTQMPSVNTLGQMPTANTVPKKKNCGPKPLAWIGTKINPAFEEWKKCSSAAGGKRKTRKGKAKKSRKTHRRRR